MVKYSMIFVILVTLSVVFAQNDGRYSTFPKTTSNQLRPGQFRSNPGRYQSGNTGRYSNNDGRYRPVNDGKYRPGNDGKYRPDDSGRYTHKDVGGGQYTGSKDISPPYIPYKDISPPYIPYKDISPPYNPYKDSQGYIGPSNAVQTTKLPKTTSAKSFIQVSTPKPLRVVTPVPQPLNFVQFNRTKPPIGLTTPKPSFVQVSTTKPPPKVFTTPEPLNFVQVSPAKLPPKVLTSTQPLAIVQVSPENPTSKVLTSAQPLSYVQVSPTKLPSNVLPSTQPLTIVQVSPTLTGDNNNQYLDANGQSILGLQANTAGLYNNPNYAIIVDGNDSQNSGDYRFKYSTENIQQRYPGALATGFYRYKRPDTITYTVNYLYAGPERFVLEAAHIPTPPPISELILRTENQRKNCA